MTASRLRLHDGHAIPRLGLGTWQIAQADAAEVVGRAIRLGYRQIDTAQTYGNEAGVGLAIRQSGFARDELFVTSKLRNGAHARDSALRAFDQTMALLGLERLDLFLIHWPVPSQDRYVEAWRTLVELRAAGRVRSIGVSNFNPDHLERIIDATGIVPVVNQIELHPRFQQRGLRALHARHGIAIQSWSPLGHGHRLDDPVIGGIARAHGCSPAQAILAWHLGQGLIAIPKSAGEQRMVENLAAAQMRLDDAAMAAIAALDASDGRTGFDPALARHGV